MPRTFVLKLMCIHIYIYLFIYSKARSSRRWSSPKTMCRSRSKQRTLAAFCPKGDPVELALPCRVVLMIVRFFVLGTFGWFWQPPKSIWVCIRMRFSSDRMPRAFGLQLIYNKARSSRRRWSQPKTMCRNSPKQRPLIAFRLKGGAVELVLPFGCVHMGVGFRYSLSLPFFPLRLKNTIRMSTPYLHSIPLRDFE